MTLKTLSNGSKHPPCPFLLFVRVRTDPCCIEHFIDLFVHFNFLHENKTCFHNFVRGEHIFSKILNLTRVKLSRAFIDAVADWSEMKTCQTSLLGQVFVGAFNHLLMLMMVIGYVKRTVSRKTEQSKLRWKDENSSTNSRSFKELLVNKRLETSSSPGYTNKKRTSYVYHVEFPHI